MAKETNDRISHLLEPGVVDTWTRLVLVNALYLYSSWLTAFDPNATHAGTFHGINADGSADFMHAVRYPSYAAGTGWVGVDLPYFGDSLVWTAVLPDAGAFDTVKSSLDAAFLADFDASSQSEQVGLTIPKLRFAARTVSWNDTLRALGMTTLFDAATSNLEGINALKPLYVKAALQQVFVELAEKGTEAAAATAVVVNTDGGITLPPPLAVVLDRPFFFFIRERGGPALFAGQIVNLPAN